jgi:hypothetical protein
MRCPVCKAENAPAIPGEGPLLCRRCKADLTLLFQLEQQRDQALSEAHAALAAGQWARAVTQAQAADWMRSDEDSRRLLAVAHLLNRNFAQAWACYQSLQAK